MIMRTFNMLCLISTLFSFIISQSKAQVVEDWIAIYDAGDADVARTMTIDDSGYIYIAGGSYLLGYSKYTTVKYNPSGNIIWVANYDGSPDSSNSDRVHAIAVDDFGNVYVTGQSYNGNNLDYVTVKYNSNGLEQWAARYNGGGDSTDIVRDIAVDDSCNVYITGRSYNGTNYNFATIKYNSIGDTLWEAFFNGVGNWQIGYGPMSIAVDDSGNVYLCGDSVSGSNFYYAIIKYNANGIKQWTETYDGFGNGINYVKDMVIDNNGNVYVTGSTCDTSNCYFSTIKYNTNGIIQWIATNDVGSNIGDIAYTIDIDDSGNIYVSGDGSEGTIVFFATIKYNSNGDTLWSSTYVVDGSMNKFVSDQAVDNFHNVYVTGYSINWPDTTEDYLTVKYNSNGILQWSAYYKGIADTFFMGKHAQAIVVDTLGNAYVTGYGLQGSSVDCITIKYGDSLSCDSVSADIFMPEMNICDWDSITLLAGGGANYLWFPADNLSDNNISNPVAYADTTTTYSVIVSNYCSSDTAQITLIVNPSLTVSLYNTNVTCNGSNDGTTSIMPSGGTPPYSYLWSSLSNDTISLSDSIANLSASTYFVILTDSIGCIITDSVTIAEPLPIVINVNSIDTVQSGNDGAIDITVSGGTLPYSFSWSNGATTEDIDSLSTGIYKVLVTDSLGCIDSLIIEVPEVTEITETNLHNQIKIYPNPLTTETTIILPFLNEMESGLFLSLYDILGRKRNISYSINNKINNVVQIKLKRGDLPAGIYFYLINTDKNLIRNGKLIIQ